MTTLHTLLHFTWCLPQTLLGLIIRGCGYKEIMAYDLQRYVLVRWLKSSMFSLGMYVFVPCDMMGIHEVHLHHEHGHSRQSLILGWLYLPVIALPSLIWHWWYYAGKPKKVSYYWFYTERWANKLAGIDLV